MKKSTFWFLNILWVFVASLVAMHAPNRAYLWLRDWKSVTTTTNYRNLTEAELRAALSELPPNFVDSIVSLHQGQPQKGSDGGMHKIDTLTGIQVDDGLQIYELVRKVKPQNTLEVGFAYGVSTMYFLAALEANGSGSHVAIDPFEVSSWNGIGLMKVREIKMEGSFEFLPEPSHPVLARLADKKTDFGVIFIDGAHWFDFAFTDFVLANALCPKGGYILLHDTWMPAIRRVISFVETNRLDFTRRPSTANNIAIFQKTGDDKRPWDDFKEF